jgi:ParB family chromosome partitioning protein
MSPIQQYWPHDLVPGGAVNCRPGDEDVSDLVASIAAHGLLQPLVGRLTGDETVEIIDGNRRLKAFQQLFAAGTVTEQVDVVLREDEPDADAFEISLAANVLRKPLHPVAEFEAFASLAERGKTNEDIAAHFGITIRQVEQRQALGRLHPEVRAAWLEGRISGDAARAFTLAEPAEQASYLAEVLAGRQYWRLQEREIRSAFTQASVPATRPVALFVGEDAYRAAGGEMVRDLFADRQEFADGGLLQRLADDRLAAVAAEVKAAEGWGEVVFGPDAQDRYMWDRLTKPALPESEKPARRIEIETRLREIDERSEAIENELDESGFNDWDDEDSAPAEIRALLTENDSLHWERIGLSSQHAEYDDEKAAWLLAPEDQRARAIATIDIESDGSLRIQRGFVKRKPGAAVAQPSALARPSAPAGRPAGEGEAEPEARLSATMMDELALTATRAAAHILAEEPRIAFAALVAAEASYYAPVRMTGRGAGEGPALPWSRNDVKSDFGTVFRECLALPQDRLMLMVSRVVAHALDFTSKAIRDVNALSPAAASALRAALPAEAHRKALVQAFDAEAYFKGAPKSEALTAIAECGDEPGKHAKLKKADLAAVAARFAGENGWLPALLRGEAFAATAPEPRLGPEPEPEETDETPAEAHLSAAEAAMQIWQDQDGAASSGPAGPPAGDEEAIPPAESAPAGDGYDRMNTRELRGWLKSIGVTVPFGATREAILALTRQVETAPSPDASEAA